MFSALRLRYGLDHASLLRMCWLCSLPLSSLMWIASALFWGQWAKATEANALRVVVNSAQDGQITADTALTLREAIALVNGTLALEQLSATEAALVTPVADALPRIEFNLPPEATTIELQTALPALTAPGLILDGTTQPGFVVGTADEPWRVKPQVALTPAVGQIISRGLTVTADRITIRGLSLYGFSSQDRPTEATLAADILVTHAAEPVDAEHRQNTDENAFAQANERPPTDVVIEQNWLGVPPQSKDIARRSVFGVFVFNGVNVAIRQNYIANHHGSAIITGRRADALRINQNWITENGLQGVPDAIRLEGRIHQTVVDQNLIENNSGSALFLFKPTGAVTIQQNRLLNNSRRLRYAAVVLMGKNHQVLDNEIQGQSGPGVIVAAFPQSHGNQILGNRFANLESLSIDLITRYNTAPTTYQVGDGPNPQRDSNNRRVDTANHAINTPLFLSPVFYILNNRVNLDGKADPGSTVILYRVSQGEAEIGPLSEPIAETKTDARGRFGFTLTDPQSGAHFSAIATHPTSGTSEPAINVEVR